MISREEIKKLAALARIELSQDEEEKFTKEVDRIIDYIAEIKKVSQPAGESASLRVKNVLREDDNAHRPGVYSKDILDNVPEREGDYIKVKKIL